MISKIEEQIIENQKSADSFISLAFLGLDVVAYIGLFCLFNCDCKVTSAKHKLYYFVLLDGISRFLSVYMSAQTKTFYQESAFTCIAAIQFYLSLSILQQIFTDKSNDSFSEKQLEIKNKSLFSFLFLCLTYSFKGLLPNYKLISGVQIVIILLSISVFYKYLKNKIDIYLSNVQKKNNNFTNINSISSLPFFVCVYFIIYHLLQLFDLMLENKLYESYVRMISIIFKEVGKYLNLILLAIIHNILNKYVKETDPGYTPQNQNNNIPNEKIQKKKMEVYKDEEEAETDKL